MVADCKRAAESYKDAQGHNMPKKSTLGLCAAALCLVAIAALKLPPVFAAPANGTPVYLPLVVKGPSQAVTILDNATSFTDLSGALWIVGEVFNNSGGPIQSVKIAADLFNASHQQLATDDNYMYLDHLPNATKTCFAVLDTAPPAGWTTYEFQPPTYSAASEGLPNLAQLSASGSVDGFGQYSLTGEVRNDEAVTVTYVEAVGTLYNAAGKVFDCDTTYVDAIPPDLTSGQSSTFALQYVTRSSYSDVTSWRLQYDGIPQ